MIRGCAGALVVGIIALGGCGRDEPPVRVASTSLASPAAPARPAASPANAAWYEPRQAWDRCHRQGHPEPKEYVSGDGSLGRTDLAHDLPILCALRPERELRLTPVLDRDGFPTAILVHEPASAAEARDTLRLSDPTDIPYQGAAWIEGEDLNGDGWTDVKVMTFYGSGGHMYDVFLYAPARQRFERDTVFSGRGNVHRVGETACVTESWHMGVAIDSRVERCWHGGRWVNARAERNTVVDRGGHPVPLHEKEVWRDGRWQVVRSDTGRVDRR